MAPDSRCVCAHNKGIVADGVSCWTTAHLLTHIRIVRYITLHPFNTHGSTDGHSCCWQLCCRADGGGVSGVAPAAGRREAGPGATALVSSQVRPGLINAVITSCEVCLVIVCILWFRLYASVACCRYAPLQERALWDGLAAIYNEACVAAVYASALCPDIVASLQLSTSRNCASLVLTQDLAAGPGAGGGRQQLWPAAAAADTQAGGCFRLHMAAFLSACGLTDTLRADFPIARVLFGRYLQQQGVPLSSAQVTALPSDHRLTIGFRMRIEPRARMMPAVLCNGLGPEPSMVLQVQFSLLSKGPEQLETLAICRDLGITVIAYSPLGLGEHRLPAAFQALCPSAPAVWGKPL
jgi:hypothetical protein